MAKTKELVIHVYNDPGHGWARVHRCLLRRLGILDKVTSYSYQNKQWVYLEEDCDAGLLVQALKEKGIPHSFKSHYSNTESRIRSYDSFKLSDDEKPKPNPSEDTRPDWVKKGYAYPPGELTSLGQNWSRSRY